MLEEDFVDKKEMIAGIIFDFDSSVEKGIFIPPNEEDCHIMAEQILNALGIYPVI